MSNPNLDSLPNVRQFIDLSILVLPTRGQREVSEGRVIGIRLQSQRNDTFGG